MKHLNFIATHKNPYYRHGFNLPAPEEFELEAEEFLKNQSSNSPFTGFGFMLVTESVFLALIDDFGSRISPREELPLRELLYRDGKKMLSEMNNYRANITDLKEEYRTLQAAFRDKNTDENFDAYIHASNIVKAVDFGQLKDLYEYDSFVSKFFDYNEHGNWRSTILSLLLEAPESEQESLLQDAIDYALFIEVMNHARKTWSPQAGAGSQSYELHLHAIIADEILKKEKKYIDDYLEENIYEGDTKALTIDSYL